MKKSRRAIAIVACASVGIVIAVVLAGGRDAVPAGMSAADVIGVKRIVSEQRSKRLPRLERITDVPRWVQTRWVRLQGVEISQETNGNVSVKAPTISGSDHYYFSKGEAGWRCEYVHHVVNGPGGVLLPGGAEMISR